MLQVAIEALNVLVDEQLNEHSAESGRFILEKLQAQKMPLVKEVRGRGLLIGIELIPEAGGARRFCEQLKEQGLLCKETHENVIRFAPPLIIDRETTAWAVGIIVDILIR